MKKNLPHPMKNHKISKKVTDKLKGQVPWNKGVKYDDWISDEGKKRNRLSHLGKKRSSESRIKQARTLSDKWKDPDYRSMIIKASLNGLFKRPTSLELRFIELFEKYSLPITYCGNGELIIGGYNPDFYVNGYKICIEVANTYFHDKKWEKRRIKHFSKYGWNCLVFWEEALSNELNIIDMLKKSINEKMNLTEANACGTPVIATRSGAVPEVVADGISGFVTENVPNMLAALKKLDMIQAKHCRLNAEKFSKEKCAERYNELIQRVLNEPW